MIKDELTGLKLSRERYLTDKLPAMGIILSLRICLADMIVPCRAGSLEHRTIISVSANNKPGKSPEEADDLYTRLNVSPNAPTEVIAAAYKALMRGTHPDLATDDADRVNRETKSKLLGEAHAILADPISRQRYDDDLRRKEQNAAQAQRNKSAQRTENNGTNTEANPETKPVSHNRTADANNVTRREPSSTPATENLREYDSLNPWLRYALWRSAQNNQQWRQVRNSMLAGRERRFKVPLAWFGAKGKPERPVEPLLRWQPVVGAVIAVAAALFTTWWYDAAPLYTTYLPEIAALFPEPGLGVIVSCIIAAGILGALWTSMFWPYIRRFRKGQRRFFIRSVLALLAIINAPVIVIALILAGIVTILITVFSPRR